jgi:LmbE family N-acetylglucosaminyl deacetylase
VTALLLSPHSDDGCLFAAYSILAHKPLVVTVLASQLQEDRGTGITHATRAAEDACAYAILGCDHTQWPYTDSDPDWGGVVNAMRLMDDRLDPSAVFAPAVEDGGHDQHNQIGELAAAVFGDRVIAYLTYTNGRERSRGGSEVPFLPSWPAVKLRALACYLSQIAEPSTGHHFIDSGLREWYA